MGIFDRMKGEIEAREAQEGMSPADLLDLSDELRSLIARIIRDQEISVKDAAEHVGGSVDSTRQMLDTLVEKGFLQREQRKNDWFYSTRFAHKRGRDIPVGIWSALGQRTSEDEE
jgi:predicted transcriptional regulator